MRECPFCGKIVSERLTQCMHCRETLPPAPQIPNDSEKEGGSQIRRGLLFMLLAAVIGYFAGGYSSLKMPLLVLPILGEYLSPLLFLAGLGLAIHGYYLQHKASLRRDSI
jgi:hypothetical protein